MIFVLLALCHFQVLSQETFPVTGIQDDRATTYAFRNATIITDYQTRMEGADLIIQKDVILQIGSNLEIPDHAVEIDLTGKYIYPSLVEIYSRYGLPSGRETGGTSRSFRMSTPQFESSKPGAYNWNEAVKSWYNASEEFQVNEKDAEQLRELGFGTVLTFRADGIARGTSSLVTLSANSPNKAMLSEKVAAHYSFDKGTSGQNYPGSLMGSIALLRQTYLDASWYKSLTDRKFSDLSLEAWNENQDLPQIFEAGDKFSALRADRIGDEFGVQYIIKGDGKEYQIIKEIRAMGTPMIIPVNFPKAPDVSDPYKNMLIPLEDLKHWELAPSNPAVLTSENIPFALTSHGLTNKKEFLPNIRKAIEQGLKEEDALRALTLEPARILQVDHLVGKLKEGMLANFLITSGDLFDENTIFYENWIQGERFVLSDMSLPDLAGTYRLTIEGEQEYTMTITGKPGKYALEMTLDDTIKLKPKFNSDRNWVRFVLDTKKNGKDAEALLFTGWVDGKNMKGHVQLADGFMANWTAEQVKPGSITDQKKKIVTPDSDDSGELIYPFVAFGAKKVPESRDVLFRNATVWTNEAEGILEHADVLVKNGKIAGVGKNLSSEGVEIIDATGKHLTSGIIDEHSHIAVSGGVNEGSRAITSEVRIADVIDPEDISIYRQLAGGVTAAQVLHGSANPIGGQSCIIKHRWGKNAEELKVDNTVGFLKHALGENVKQSRYPSNMAIRYPQSRMGVEQIIRDGYLRAKGYLESWDRYNRLSPKEKARMTKPRRDLRLEAIGEVLQKKSFITCHTYVQSETNMIMKLAEDFNVKAHTLIHNTEGYKIADKMKEHGAAGSIFSDWWAFKYEVYHAIPYNAALHLDQGVLTCIHSDDAELSRRLHQEAAKAVKYGGVTEEEAWKLVTLNPARILHLDHRMGSIKNGKDADLVLWSDNPLSIYAKAEKTMVDGVFYFDLERDAGLQQYIQQERNRIIRKMTAEGKDSPPVNRTRSNQQFLWDDEEIIDIFKEKRTIESNNQNR